MTAAQNSEWVWIEPSVVLAVHDEQLAEHGGAAGVRDPALLASALARPRQLAADGDPDLADIAAAYGFGLARNHPFVDGNKRTAFVAVELSLALNGHWLTATHSACVLTMLSLAAGELDETAFVAWIRGNTSPRR